MFVARAGWATAFRIIGAGAFKGTMFLPFGKPSETEPKRFPAVEVGLRLEAQARQASPKAATARHT